MPSQELELSAQADLSQSPLSPLVLSRHQEGEAAMAESLLGGPVTSASQGGGIVTYTGEAGSIQFRSGGGFDGGELTRDVEDAAGFVREFCQNYGYEDVDIQLTGGDGAVDSPAVRGRRSHRRLRPHPDVPGWDVDRGIRGPHQPGGRRHGGERAVELRHRPGPLPGLPPGRRRGLQTRYLRVCVYQLQSSPSSLRLVPLWRIDTDTYAYYVDCASGSVVRA